MARAAAIVLATLLPASVQAATFTFRDFLIPNATSVSINAINDFGVVAGTYVSASATSGAGFTGRRGQIVSIGNYPTGGPNPSVPQPSGITNEGTVIGTVYTGLVSQFTWKDGAYTTTFGAASVGGFNYVPPFLTTGNHVSYNQYGGDGIYTPFAGTIGNEQQINIGGFATITSTNRRSEIAGEYQTFAGSKPTVAVFLGGPKKVAPLLPPGATASAGGWLNDVGQVAGTYRDKAANFHGFLYARGKYTSFDMPSLPTTLSVQGIDLSGRVVGAYQDRTGQHGFYYSQGTVTKLGTLAATDTVHVSISHFGRAIALSVTRSDNTSRSYLVRCVAGPGAC